jgi:hypothetical protein
LNELKGYVFCVLPRHLNILARSEYCHVKLDNACAFCTFAFAPCSFLQYHYTVMTATTPAAKQKKTMNKATKEAAKRKEVKQWKIANKTVKAHKTSPGVTPSAARPMSKGADTLLAKLGRKNAAAKPYQEQRRAGEAEKAHAYHDEYSAKLAELHYEDLRANASFVQLESDIGMSQSDAVPRRRSTSWCSSARRLCDRIVKKRARCFTQA